MNCLVLIDGFLAFSSRFPEGGLRPLRSLRMGDLPDLRIRMVTYYPAAKIHMADGKL